MSVSRGLVPPPHLAPAERRGFFVPAGYADYPEGWRRTGQMQRDGRCEVRPLLIAAASFFPRGIVHGVGIWFGGW